MADYITSQSVFSFLFLVILTSCAAEGEELV